MKKYLLLSIIILFSGNKLFSQHSTVSVVATQGEVDHTKTLIFEWTLGEIFTETITAKDKILTQGLHQPHLIALKINEVNALSLDHIRIYPNPVNAILNIQLHKDYLGYYKIYLFDSNGRFIKVLNVNEGNSNLTLDMTNLSSGIYILKI